MKNKYLETGDKKACNGCGICELICPKKCIKMIEDEEGFLYPVIDKDECINCNKCKRECANYPQKNTFDIKAYALKNNDEKERKESTSGGMFYILVKYIIEKEGIVFGVKYDENLIVKHDYSEHLSGCKQFSVSKYVRSDLGDSYIRAKEFLDQGRYVLFSGTPCQVYGFKKYLNKDYEKLILCEIICHANPSPKIFKMYLKNRENKKSKKVKAMYFRSKNQEMKNKPYIEYEDGEKQQDGEFNKAFVSQLINRPSCNNCEFVDINRKSDFTIGDFWGIDKTLKNFDDGKGVSLVTVNSEKAAKIFDEIKENFISKESNLETAFKSNHHYNLPQHKKRKEFFEKIEVGEITEENIIKYFKMYTKENIQKKVVKKIKQYFKILRRAK